MYTPWEHDRRWAEGERKRNFAAAAARRMRVQADYECPICGAVGEHRPGQCPVDRGDASLPIYNKRCVICHNRGHIPEDCGAFKKWRRTMLEEHPAYAWPSLAERHYCFVCGSRQHLLNRCDPDLRFRFEGFMFHCGGANRTTRLELSQKFIAGRQICKEKPYNGRDAVAKAQAKAKAAYADARARAEMTPEAVAMKLFAYDEQKREREAFWERARVAPPNWNITKMLLKMSRDEEEED